jgi:hypothetical protein
MFVLPYTSFILVAEGSICFSYRMRTFTYFERPFRQSRPMYFTDRSFGVANGHQVQY